MELRLQRTYLGEATLGVLHHPGGRLWTLEDTLVDDGLAKGSCVPEGEYTLEHHSTEMFPETWALVGRDVSHWPGPKRRSTILFHAGNTTEDTRGCILVGWAFKLGPPAYLEASRTAMRILRTELRKAVPGETIRLYIQGG